MSWEEKALEIAEGTAPVPQIQPLDVPDLELYMDQLVTFLDQRLGSTKRHQEDPFVTSTMVNNYTKANLVRPAVKKRYQRHHVLGLSLVGQLKRVLSMQDLGRIATATQQEEEQLYALFLEAQRQTFAQSPQLMEGCIQQCSKLELSQNAALAALAVQLAAEAQCRVLLAERLLDAISLPKSEESRKKAKHETTT